MIQIFVILVLNHIFHNKECAKNVLISSCAKIAVELQTNAYLVKQDTFQTKMDNVKLAIKSTLQCNLAKAVNYLLINLELYATNVLPATEIKMEHA